MFGFFRKKSSSERDDVLNDLRQAQEELASADSMTRIKVGMAVNTASTAFAATFKSPAAFQNISREQQLEYMTKLKNAERQARTNQDSTAALGFGLFNIWLCALITNDDHLMGQIKPTLATISREADAL